jgi:hypothetical protein
MLTDIQVQELIRNGRLDEAQRTLDAAYLYQLHLLMEFDPLLAGDERHTRVRNKLVKMLQMQWMRYPPQYLDEPSAAYLQQVCSTIPDCPPGKVVGQRPLSEVPNP